MKKNIQNYIIELYKNKDLGTEFKSNINLSNDINIYNNEKISTHQYVTKLYETYKENYNINVVPLNSMVTDNNILFSYQVITEYNKALIILQLLIMQEQTTIKPHLHAAKAQYLIMIFLQFQAAMTVLILFLMHYLQAEQTLMIPEEMELAVADGISEV